MPEVAEAGASHFKYWAFISYSHADAGWGKRLHKKLESYRVPRSLAGRPSRDGKVPRRLFPIFRDREELPVSSDLGANLKNSIEQSRYLIVICSPAAAQSRWVNEEVRHFKGHRGEGRILCLIVAGEPNATDKPGAALSECFPEAVRYRVLPGGELSPERTEPIAADARREADGPRRAKIKLLAGLLGVDFDELWKRERRRRVKRLLLSVAALICLTTGSAITWQWAARRQARLSQMAHHLERGAHELQAGRRLQAAGFLAMAHRLGASGDAFEAMLRDSSKALIEPITVLKGGHSDWITCAKFIDTAHVITSSWDGTVRRWDLATSTSTLLFRESDKVTEVSVSPEGSRFVTAIWGGLAHVWSREGVLLATLQHAGRVNSAEFSPDSRLVVTASDDYTAKIWKLAAEPPLEPVVLSGHEGIVKTAVFSANGDRVLTASFDTSAKIWETATGIRLLTLVPQPAAVNAAAFSPDARSVATACLNGNILLWDASTTSQLQIWIGHAGNRANSVAFSPDGTRLVTTGDDRSAKVWSIATGELILSYERHRDIVVHATFSPEGDRVVTASKDGTSAIFDARSRSLRMDEIVALAEKLAPSPP